MRISVLVIAAAMVFSAPALAQVETPPPPETVGAGVSETDVAASTEDSAAPEQPAAVEAAAEPELVCRTITARTESRLRSQRQRVCKTQAEWDAQEAASSRER